MRPRSHCSRAAVGPICQRLALERYPVLVWAVRSNACVPESAPTFPHSILGRSTPIDRLRYPIDIKTHRSVDDPAANHEYGGEQPDPAFAHFVVADFEGIVVNHFDGAAQPSAPPGHCSMIGPGWKFTDPPISHTRRLKRWAQLALPVSIVIFGHLGILSGGIGLYALFGAFGPEGWNKVHPCDQGGPVGWVAAIGAFLAQLCQPVGVGFRLARNWAIISCSMAFWPEQWHPGFGPV